MIGTDMTKSPDKPGLQKKYLPGPTGQGVGVPLLEFRSFEIRYAGTRFSACAMQ